MTKEIISYGTQVNFGTVLIVETGSVSMSSMGDKISSKSVKSNLSSNMKKIFHIPEK